MITKTELELHIMLYAQQRIINGQLGECLELGFDMEALRMIHNLDLAALSQCNGLRKAGIISAITVNNRALAKLAQEVNQAVELESVIEQLLQGGASATLLRHFFGLSRQDIYDRRTLLSLPANPRGRRIQRVTTLSEEILILHKLREALQAVEAKDRSTAAAQCRALLRVATDTRHCINEVWDIAKRHCLRGTFAWEPPRTSQTGCP